MKKMKTKYKLKKKELMVEILRFFFTEILDFYRYLIYNKSGEIIWEKIERKY